MIISDVNKTRNRENATDNVYIKSESDSISDDTPFIEQLPETPSGGIIVAVETSKHNTNRIREAMEQNGAVKIYICFAI